MRLTEFWTRMEAHFGTAYARSWARDHRLAELEGRTVDEALAAGVDAVRVWRAVWRHEGLPDVER